MENLPRIRTEIPLKIPLEILPCISFLSSMGSYKKSSSISCRKLETWNSFRNFFKNSFKISSEDSFKNSFKTDFRHFHYTISVLLFSISYRVYFSENLVQRFFNNSPLDAFTNLSENLSWLASEMLLVYFGTPSRDSPRNFCKDYLRKKYRDFIKGN